MALLVRDHRVALLDLTGPDARVLLIGGRLPDVPDRWPEPTDLLAAAGAADAQVAGPATREPDGTVTNVLVGLGHSDLDGSWAPLEDLGDAQGVSASARAALAETVRVLRGGTVTDGRAAWFRPGWQGDATAWIDDRLAEHGLRRVGAPYPVKLWSLSAVLRVQVGPVVSGAPGERTVWFKETCDGYRAEAGLTATLASLAPAAVPRVLAVDAGAARMLLEDVPDAHLGADPAHVGAIAESLARLQLDTLPDLGVLRTAGAPDRGLVASLAGVRRVLTGSVELPLLTDEQRGRLPALGAWLADRLERLWAHPLPDVLTHGDLHLGNVARVDGRSVFFDWTDLCVSHPFLDAWHLATSAARESGDPGVVDTVWAAFCAPWAAARSDVDLDAVWVEVEVAEAAFVLETYEDLYRAQPEVSRWELSGEVASVVERLLRLMDAG